MSVLKSLCGYYVQVATEPTEDIYMLIPLIWSNARISIELYVVCDIYNNPGKLVGDYSKEISKELYDFFKKG